MSNIKVGDLVMVVKPNFCGCNNSSMPTGSVFEVRWVGNNGKPKRCMACGEVLLDGVTCSDSSGRHALIERLIKIEPPALPESLEREKELSV
jgi:hypothetical protein